MGLLPNLIQIVLYGVLLVIASVNSNEENEQVKSVNYGAKSPLYLMYLEWVAENLNKEDFNRHLYEMSSAVMERRSVESTFPAIEAYFIYRLNRPKCINLGDEGCINGSIPGSGSDSGYLTGGNNPGK